LDAPAADLGLTQHRRDAVYSATYEAGQHLSPWTIRQLSWAALGLLGMVVTFAIDYRRLERWAYPLYGFSLVLLLLVPVLGSFGGRAALD